MKKSPSLLFNILSDDSKKSRAEKVRQSMDAAREPRMGAEEEEADAAVRRVSVEKNRGGNLVVEAIKAATDGDGSAAAVAAAVSAAPAALTTTPESSSSAPESATIKIAGASGPGLEPPTPAAFVRTLLGNLYVPADHLSGAHEIGEGGFAKIMRATYTHKSGLKQIVAVKRLRPERVTAEEDLSEFLAEANLWRKLQSQDIVKLVGVGAGNLASFEEMRRSMYIVSEFMAGGTLRSCIEKQMISNRKDVYSFVDVFRWFVAIARGVKYLHACRPAIIHRDIKPENVLLTTADAGSAEAKLIDLGLHMRGRRGRPSGSPGTLGGGDRGEGSYYGGSAYDALALNGSVYAGGVSAPAAPPSQMSLEEKVILAEMRSVEGGAVGAKHASPQSTVHGTVRSDKTLHPIAEDPGVEHAGVSAAMEVAVAAAPAPDALQSSAGTDATSSPDSSNLGRPRPRRTSSSVAALAPGDDAGRSAAPRSSAAPTPGSLRDRRNVSHASLTSQASSAPADLTSKVGSYMYMAPEMSTTHSYNEKVDVFGLAVMLFEAVRGRLNIVRVAIDGDPEAIQRYTERVALGFREEIPRVWPQVLRELIEAGWAQDPRDRLSASDFLRSLTAMIDNGVPQDMEANPAMKTRIGGVNDCDCGVCAVM